MKYTVLTVLASLIVLLTGCSNDEIGMGDYNRQSTCVSVSTDASTHTRTNPAEITRYAMEVYKDENCTTAANVFGHGDAATYKAQSDNGEFYMTLDKEQSYYCLFWADNGEYTIDDLKAVTSGTDKQVTEAYHGKSSISGTEKEVSVTLKRAVAKLTLEESGALAAGTLKVAYAHKTQFNVATAKTIGTETAQSKEMTVSETGGGAIGGTVLLLADAGEATLHNFEFTYTTAGGSARPAFTVSNVPLRANYITGIKGHFSGNTAYSFEVTCEDTWNTPDNKFPQPTDKMTFVIDLTNTNYSTSFTLPFYPGLETGDYILTVDWGDNSELMTIAPHTTLDLDLLTHAYTDRQEYTITIASSQDDATKVQMPRFRTTSNENSNEKLKAMTSPILNTGMTSFSSCFQYCTSLTTIPENLFEKNTGVTSFSYCFLSCTSLTAIPEKLFATNTEATNFSYCFENCISLTAIPETLFATNTEATNFSYCFKSCISLTTIPQKLFAANTEATDFSFCFNNCSGLTMIPATLFAANTKATDFSSCFQYCTSLTAIPETLFATNTEATNFSYCFSQCKTLTEIPATLFAANTKATDFKSCFVNCNQLTTIPGTLFEKNTEVTYFNECFSQCSKLTTIPEKLFTASTKATDFNKCFYQCKVLTTIPGTLFATNTQAADFSKCFSYCNELTEIPAGLFKKNTEASNFSECFYECTKAKLNANIFCDETTEKATRFQGVGKIDFTSCFKDCATYSVTGFDAGTAPALWTYTYGSEPNTSSCFYGIGAVGNKGDIADSWKGSPN